MKKAPQIQKKKKKKRERDIGKMILFESLFN